MPLDVKFVCAKLGCKNAANRWAKHKDATPPKYGTHFHDVPFSG
jgi:hypothetical protein